jgi:hypothetical protein
MALPMVPAMIVNSPSGSKRNSMRSLKMPVLST